MENQEIIENNRLIAEFMGMSFETFKGVEYIKNAGEHEANIMDDLKYEISWDWLMPVVEKIEDTEISNGYYVDFDIYSKAISVSTTGGEQIILLNESEGTFTDKKTATYQAVVQFIKWYNDNK